MKERYKLLIILAVFLFFYFVPLGGGRIQSALLEGFQMLQEYARLHVLLCLVPAFFIAGAIQNFISKEAILKYFGPKSNKALAYSIASVSGAILAVCSCTVLPMFMGIYTAGAGLGVAATFLYSGPAINVLAILMTGRVLGLELGLARTISAIVFSVIIGLLMAFIFMRSEKARAEASGAFDMEAAKGGRRLWQNILYFASMILALIFLTWGKPKDPIGFYNTVFSVKWYLAGASLIGLALMVWRWFNSDERKAWVASTWTFTKQIMPLLFGGVFVAGFLLGRPGLDAGIIPNHVVAGLVGGNSLWSNLFASLSGALMYFATLTEIPILQGLIGSGMGKGPSLALLLAGPALSLPSMIVVIRLVGAKRGLTYVGLVVVLSTVAGVLFGALM
jgi:uncharacterized membrane protein YraQ (UPF0718 family)